MEDLLIQTLEKMGYDIIRQGSMADEEKYPESFFTFWNNDCYGRGFYDNRETQSVWDYDLNFYSTDPSLTYTKLMEAKKLLKSAGFIVNGKGHDVPSDESTHTGRGINIFYLENEQD